MALKKLLLVVIVSNVLIQLVCASESLTTFGTQEGLFAIVQANVLVPGSRFDELSGTVRAGEGSLSCVNESMLLHVYQPLTRLGAVKARIGHEVAFPVFYSFTIVKEEKINRDRCRSPRALLWTVPVPFFLIQCSLRPRVTHKKERSHRKPFFRPVMRVPIPERNKCTAARGCVLRHSREPRGDSMDIDEQEKKFYQALDQLSHSMTRLTNTMVSHVTKRSPQLYAKTKLHLLSSIGGLSKAVVKVQPA